MAVYSESILIARLDARLAAARQVVTSREMSRFSPMTSLTGASVSRAKGATVREKGER